MMDISRTLLFIFIRKLLTNCKILLNWKCLSLKKAENSSKRETFVQSFPLRSNILYILRLHKGMSLHNFSNRKISEILLVYKSRTLHKIRNDTFRLFTLWSSMVVLTGSLLKFSNCSTISCMSTFDVSDWWTVM